MNEKNNVTGLGITTECALLEQSLTSAINNSKLPVSMIRLILQNLLSQVQMIERTALQNEQDEYKKQAVVVDEPALERTEENK